MVFFRVFGEIRVDIYWKVVFYLWDFGFLFVFGFGLWGFDLDDVIEVIKFCFKFGEREFRGGDG